MTMKAQIVKIGNSQGIRIPKPLLLQTGLKKNVEITARGDSIIIRPARKPREGWLEEFKEMAKRGEDALLDDVPYPLSSWDEEEWEW
jgi:antitoxin MazE